MGLASGEQEVTINIMRTDDVCSLYTSDATWITKLEKMVEKNPEQFKRVKVTQWGNTYEFPKRFISIRSGDVRLSDDEKTARAKRLRDVRP